MDLLGWISARFERSRAFRYTLIFFSFYAPLTYILGRLAKGKGWLNDFDALICGADYVRRGLSPYSLQPVCEGLNPAPYVYAPQWGMWLSPLIETFGIMPLKAIYALFYLPILGLIFWYGLKSALPRLTTPVRLMAFSILTGSSLQSGNIGIMCHGLVLLAALQLERRRWPFVLTVVLVSLMKPVLLTYLVVLLLEDRPAKSRLTYAAVGSVLGLAGTWLMISQTGPLGGEWQAMLSGIVLSDQVGSSFFGWMSWIGVSGKSALGLSLYAFYALNMLIAGVILAEFGATTTRERLVIGLGMAALLNPRLMDYDMLALPLSLGFTVALAKPLGAKAETWAGNLFVGICFVCLVLNLLVIKGLKPAPFAIFGFAILTLMVATFMARNYRDKWPPWLKPLMG